MKHTQSYWNEVYVLEYPRYNHVKHSWLNNASIDFTNDKFFTNKSNPGLKMVTFGNEVGFEHHIVFTLNSKNSENS